MSAAEAIAAALQTREGGPPRKQSLPAGFQGVVWGATPEGVQAIRGRPLEGQPTSDPHVSWLIEWPIPGEETANDTGIVKWRFWDNHLIEVQQYLPGELTHTEGRELVTRFEQRYGPGDAKKQGQGTEMAYGVLTEVERPANQWIWQDDFTLQFLHQEREKQQWAVIRQSRILEAARTIQEIKERAMVKSPRIQNVTIE